MQRIPEQEHLVVYTPTSVQATHRLAKRWNRNLSSFKTEILESEMHTEPENKHEVESGDQES